MDGFWNLDSLFVSRSAQVFRRTFAILLLGFACVVSSHAANIVAHYTQPSVIPVTAANYVASGNILSAYLSFDPRTGTNLTVVRNTGLSFIQGRFTDLPHGKVISLQHNGINYRFVANYYGGDGNDLVLEWYRRSVIAWGANGVGQLGNASTMASKVPIDISSSGALDGKTVFAVSASSGGHNLALCSDGTMVAWGNNAYGQLGDGTTNQRTTPVAVLRSGALTGKYVIAIATGTHHSLALCSDGTIAAWGRNHKGQLGNGNLSSSSIPVVVTRTGVLAGKIPVQLSAEVDQNMALCSDGTVVTWGDNTFGQLGNGSSAARSDVPVLLTRTGVLAGKTITSVSMGGRHGLVLCSDGTLATWGANSNGQLGNNTLVASRVPVLVNRSGVLAGKVAKLIDAGNNHNLVHCSDGTLASWGGGTSGQLGNNSSVDSMVPVLVTRGSALKTRVIASLSAGSAFSLVTCTDGSAASWGTNNSGILGNNSTTQARTPVLVDRSGILSDHVARAPSAGNAHSVVLAAVPSITELESLEVGNATITPAFDPKVLSYKTTIPIGTTEISFRPTARSKYATVRVNQTLIASGSKISIPFASMGSTVQIVVTAESGAQKIYKFSPPPSLNGIYTSASTVPLNFVAYSAAGKAVNLMLQFRPPSGTTFMVVNNTSLRFIEGRFENLAHGQIVVLPFEGLNYRFVANYYGGSGNDLVLEWADRYAYAWGSNFSGQLGNSQLSASTSRVPVEVTRSGVLAGKTILKLATGDSHTLALCSDNSIVSWGSNTNGQLGNGTTATIPTPPVLVNIPDEMFGKRIVDISAGLATSLALCSDGNLYAWGLNHLGQLGNGTTADSLVPQAVDRTGVLAGKQVVAISAGGSHQLVLTDEGELFAWGANTYGQLGNGNTTSSHVPVKVTADGVLSAKFVVSISAGTSHSLALCQDRTIVAWGRGSDGRLGDGSVSNRNVPVRVDSSDVLLNKGIRKVSAGEAHSLVLCADGTIAAWGLNSSGQLGDGTLLAKSQPVAVLQSGIMTGKIPIALDAGANHAVVKCSDGSAFGWGSNIFGQLGSTSTASSVSSPVQVMEIGSPSPWTIADLSAGSAFTAAIASAPLSSDSALSDLAFSKGTLDFAFSSGRTAYYCAVPRVWSSISVTPTARHDRARVHVNGVNVENGIASAPIPLINTSTLIDVRVTAEDGSFTNYTVNVMRSEGVDGTFGSPTFIPATYPAYDPTGTSLFPFLAFAPEPGTNLTLIRITGLNFIEGRFANLAHGQEINLQFNGIHYPFIVNYYGGSGNDLVLEWGRRGLAGWGYPHLGLMESTSGNSVITPVAVPLRGVLQGRKVLVLSSYAAICADGTLATWGGNANGQLGNGSTDPSDIPVAVDRSGVLSGKTIISVKSNGLFCLVLCSDGTLASWGYNFYGNLGDGSTESRKNPVLVVNTGVLAGKKVVAIDVGSYHCLALCSDGSVVSWGYNGSGNLGTGNWTGSSVPVAVNASGVLLGKTVVAIAAGDSHSLVLCSDGTVATWGSNLSGQLGNGSFSSSSLPTEVVRTGGLAGKQIVGLGTRGSLCYALCSDGTVVTWGVGGSGQLGNGTSLDSRVPVAVASDGALAGKLVSAVSSGGSHMVAKCTDGSLVAWGDNTYGQLGNETLLNSNVPVPVKQSGYLAGKNIISLNPSSGSCIVQVSVSASSRLASLTTIDGMFTNDFDPELTSYQFLGPASISNIRLLPTSESNQAVIRINGVIVPSGTPSEPIPFTAGSPPVEIVITAEDLTTTTYTILPPPTFAAAFTSASDVPLDMPFAVAEGWPLALSLNFAPTTGTNLKVMNVRDPAFILGEFQNLAQGQIVELPYNGRKYRFAVNYHGGTGNDLVLEWANRSLASWGEGFLGIMGDGGTVNSKIPVAVERNGALAGRTVVSISASSFHTLAVCADGTLLGWGSNQYGNLGLGDAPSSLVPAVLNRGALAGKKVIAAHTGSIYNLALCSDGTLAAWGGGSILKFATGSTANITVPTEVPKLGALAGKNVVAVSVGDGHFLVLCSDGTMVSWGRNQYAQTGSGVGGADDALPVKVVDTGALAGKKVISIGTGLGFSAALCSDGKVAVWGAYLVGSVYYTTPVLISVDALPSSFVESFAVSTENLAFLSANGTMGTSGVGLSGQIGNNSTKNLTNPTSISKFGAMAGRTVKSLGVGNLCMFAITTDHQILGWGSNLRGRLGVGGGSNILVPSIVDPNSELYGTVPLAVASGGALHTHAILALPDEGYVNWMSGRMGLTNKTERGDPDGDGIPNLVEYAFGSDPATISKSSLPVHSVSGNDDVFRFERQVDAIDDTEQIFQYSSDLILWTDVRISSPASAGVSLGVVNSDGRQSVEVVVPMGRRSQIFGRLKVSRR